MRLTIYAAINKNEGKNKFQNEPNVLMNCANK